MSICDLPSELKGAILDELADDKTSLRCCRLISKDFEGIAAPLAFKTLNLSRRQGCSGKFTELLRGQSPIPNHVKEIHFSALETQRHVFKADDIDDTIAMFGHLSEFPDLKALRLYFHDEFEEDVYEIENGDMSPIRALQIGIFEALADSVLRNHLDLQELEIHGLLALPNESFHLDGTGPLFANLLMLQVRLVTTDAEYFDFTDEDYRMFWDVDLAKVLGAAQNLENLILISDEDTCGFSLQGWSRISLPNLKHIRLESIVFTYSQDFEQKAIPPDHAGVEGFILRHGQSLESLDLSSCAIEVAEGDANPRAWATIWKTFETSLPRLRSFKFDPLPGQHLPGDEFCGFEGYVFYLEECRFVHDFDEHPVNATLDRAAYTSLQRVIGERKFALGS